MKLLTRKIIKSLPSTKSVKSIPLNERLLFSHIYNPIGTGNWLIMGGDEVDNDYIAYGIQILDDCVVCSFSIRDLESVRLPFGEKLRRDRSFKKMSFKEFKENLHLILD